MRTALLISCAVLTCGTVARMLFGNISILPEFKLKVLPEFKLKDSLYCEASQDSWLRGRLATAEEASNEVARSILRELG